jgi:DNA-binding transcriptional LysR family regulator
MSASTPAHPNDLAEHRLILFPFPPFRTRWLFRDSGGILLEQAVDGDLILSPASALRDAALAGLGAAMLPDWLVASDIAQGRLIHVLKQWDVTATSFDTAAWLVYPSRSYLPGKTRAMIDFLKGNVP